MGSYNIAEFRDLVRRAKYASDPEVKLALARVASEAKTKLAEPSEGTDQFFDALRHSLRHLKGNGNADLRIGCLLDCANYFYVAGDIFQGIEASQDAVKLARQVKDDRALRKSKTVLGILLADSGAVAQAIEAHVDAITIAKELDDHHGHVVSLMNLGVALLYGAQLKDAVSCLSLTETLALESSVTRQYLPHILANKAACYLQLGSIEEGLGAARSSITPDDAAETAGQTFSRMVREFNYLQLLLEKEQYRDAAERARVIQGCAFRVPTPRAHSLAEVSSGLVEVFCGDANEGLRTLTRLKRELAKTGTLYQDVLIALVKAFEELGRFDEALETLQQYMELVRRNREASAVWHICSGSRYLKPRSAHREGLERLEHREALLRARVAEGRLFWHQVEMLERMSVTADLKEESSGEHGYRVGRLSSELAAELGWVSESCMNLDLAARLHDIGKIGVPDRILLTSETLKEAERHFMSTHTLIGAELLAQSRLPQLRMAEEIALLHHEWWDGNGYPKKLAGKRIPIHARIVALADVFDALTHGRPYSPPWSIDEALDEIRRRRGTQFDPELTDRFLALIERLRAAHPDLDEFLGRAARNSPFLQARQKIKLMLAREREHEEQHKATVPGNRTRH